MSLTIDRRDFLKLNLFSFIQILFLRAFGGNFDFKQCGDFDILDKLLELDFSEDVKSEIIFRVGLQKKYGYDQNGKLLPYDRFLKEAANFVVYKGNLRDAVIYQEATKFDVGYVITKAAYYNKVDKLDYFLQKLVGNGNGIYAKAVLSSLDNKSIESFCRLMTFRNHIDDKTMDRVYELLCQERYMPELKELQNLLPNLASKQKREITPKFSAITQFSDHDEPYGQNMNEWLLDAAKECMRYILAILQKQGEIELFEIAITAKKLCIKIIAKSYPIDFMQTLNRLFVSYLPQKLIWMVENLDILIVECE